MIHKTAIIHETAKIDSSVEIGAYSVIGENVIIESGCKIGENANIQFAKIGKNTRISPFASIGGEPQDLGYKGEKTGVIIGENCFDDFFFPCPFILCLDFINKRKTGFQRFQCNVLFRTEKNIQQRSFLHDLLSLNNAVCSRPCKVCCIFSIPHIRNHTAAQCSIVDRILIASARFHFAAVIAQQQIKTAYPSVRISRGICHWISGEIDRHGKHITGADVHGQRRSPVSGKKFQRQRNRFLSVTDRADRHIKAAQQHAKRQSGGEKSSKPLHRNLSAPLKIY